VRLANPIQMRSARLGVGLLPFPFLFSLFFFFLGSAKQENHRSEARRPRTYLFPPLFLFSLPSFSRLIGMQIVNEAQAMPLYSLARKTVPFFSFFPSLMTMVIINEYRKKGRATGPAREQFRVGWRFFSTPPLYPREVRNNKSWRRSAASGPFM